MSGLFGGGKTVSNSEQALFGMQIQTSAYGLVIPLVYGRTRVGANLIYYSDFKAIPHTTSQQAGKSGGGGSTVTNTTYTYEAAVMLGLCEGPVLALGKWWRDKDGFEALDSRWYAAQGLAAQVPWPFLQTKHPSQAIGYGSTCYVADNQMDLGSSGSTKNHSFEVWGLCAHPTLGDANPKDVILDYCTNAIHGCGFYKLDTAQLADYGNACLAAGARISPAWSDQMPAADQLDEILKATNAAPLWSGDKLKIMPFFDSPLSSSEGSWTPNTTPVYDLGPGDFITDGVDDPIRVTRKTQADAFNRVKVEFKNQANDYNLDMADAPDQANIEAYGERLKDPVRLHCITHADLARNAAQWILQRELYIRNVYEFKLGPRHFPLEPFDLVTLTDAKLGLSNTPARIRKVVDNPDYSLTVTAEEWPFGVASATQYASPGGDGGGPNTQAPPGDAQQPIILEPPMDLTNGTAQVWLGTCGGADWGGCEIWASRDGNSYSQVGLIVNPSRMGFTTTPMPAASAAVIVNGVDTSTVLGVDLSQSSGQLISASSADAARFETPTWVDGEIFSYQNATLTGPNTYDLQLLRRGLWGSANGGHATGKPILRLDDAVGKVDLDRWNIGDTIQFKLVSFNLWGLAKQDIAAVPAYSYTITGASAQFPAPSGVTVALTNTRPI